MALLNCSLSIPTCKKMNAVSSLKSETLNDINEAIEIVKQLDYDVDYLDLAVQLLYKKDSFYDGMPRDKMVAVIINFISDIKQWYFQDKYHTFDGKDF